MKLYLTGENKVFEEKPVRVTLCPPQIQHELLYKKRCKAKPNVIQWISLENFLVSGLSWGKNHKY